MLVYDSDTTADNFNSKLDFLWLENRAFVSSPNIIREVKDLFRDFKKIAW